MTKTESKLWGDSFRFRTLQNSIRRRNEIAVEVVGAYR
ncbi:hypothetical protein SLEP1_g49485 [Rubroshorea leprosula]|uniref:Uncharacterized protein n=1 Tax=Rubroshorea leprosula TaxID=152421 RepID=A0AAV5M081_9ROSI|nr:hypothetical protein SLEP1_g49485 [Rubroshorea leprosula]